jgi:hypothetical protein
MTAAHSTVACPACRDPVPVDAVSRQSRRLRCGCGAHFDLVPPRHEGGTFGPYRGDAEDARLTPPPVDDDIVDLSGRCRTRFVRIHQRADRRERLARGLVAGLLVGLLLGVLGWAVTHSVSGAGAAGLVFLATLATIGAVAAFPALTGSAAPREIWIEGGAMRWGRSRSRPLTAIDAICLAGHDVATGSFLAFGLPSGRAARFMRVDHLSGEAREWLVEHLNDGIALAKSEQT